MALHSALTLADVLAGTGGALVSRAAGEIAFTSVSIDSRTLEPGALFVAVRGARFDGHDFLAEAAGRGARAALVHRDAPAPAGLPLVRVADTTRGLSDLARRVRRAAGVPVVGVTGSIGKTTTKDMTAHLLSTRGPVLKTEGNLNNQYGLPLTLLRLAPEHTAAVVELGMSAPGEIRALAALAEPDVATITRIAPVHLEFFPSVDAIAAAKAEILEGLRPGGTAVLNGDDPRVRAIGERFRGRVVWFGRDRRCDVSARGRPGASRGPGVGMTLRPPRSPGVPSTWPCRSSGRTSWRTSSPPPPPRTSSGSPPRRWRRPRPRSGPPATAARSSAWARASPSSTTATTPRPRPSRPRSRPSPSCRGAAGWPCWATCSSSAPSGPALHRERGRALAGRVDAVLGVGPLAREIVEGAREAGLTALEHFATAADAAAALPGLVRPGDAVLVKGSRGVKLEAVVEALAARFGEGEA